MFIQCLSIKLVFWLFMMWKKGYWRGHKLSSKSCLIFQLQRDMNQIFQMSYYEAMQFIGLQSYNPSKFIKTEDGPRASLAHNDFSWNRPSDPNDFWPRTLTAHNFKINCHWKFYSNSFETSDSYLFRSVDPSKTLQ